MRSLLPRAALLLLASAAISTAFAACGSGDDTAAGKPSGGYNTDASADSSTDGGQGGSASDVMVVDQASETGCKTGDPCGDGGVCAGGSCCTPELACGDACCSSGQLCSFMKCVSPGAACTSSGDCPDQQYCEYALGETPDAGAPDAAADAEAEGGVCQGGAKLQSGRCLPKPPVCATADAGVPGSGELTCLPSCEYHAATPDFSPVLKYAWGGEVVSPWSSDVMMTPIVVQLDDDDCDGKVTANDIPEILFTTHSAGQYQSPGPVHAISILDQKIVDKWTFPGIQPSAQLAGGNIDGQPGNEVIACAHDGTVQALKGDGTSLWKSPAITCFQPSLADLEADGEVEVVVEGGVLDGKTGAIKATFTPAMDGTFLVSDIDGDGKLDIVTGTQAYHADGTQFVNTGVTGVNYASSPYFKSGPAVADLDKDGKPEVIAVYFMTHQVAIWQYDATQTGGFKFVRPAIDINGSLSPTLCTAGSAGSKWGGGPATVGDFNGDGFADVALAGGVGYSVFDGKKLMDPAIADADTFLWAKQTHDCSSSGTGSSLFDFNGDGRSEVIYSDEYFLRIYQGDTGDVLFETCNTTHTLNEYPVIADVDNDGQADIVVVSNAHNTNIQCNGTQQSGVRVFGSAAGSWVRTRRIWNQHAYHITNVEEDGTIPKQELVNWTQPGLNNFRLNKQPGGEFSAPDAVVSVAFVCPGPYLLTATVRNMGQAALPAGLVVGLYAGDEPSATKLGEVTTTRELYPAQAEVVSIPLANAPKELLQGDIAAWARIENGAGLRQCLTDNDTSPKVTAKCASGPR